MRAPRNHVENIRIPLDDCRQRVEHHLEALAGRDQPEGGEQEALLHPFEPAEARRDVARTAARVELGARRSELDRGAVGHDIDLLGRTRADLNQQAPRRHGHHDHALRLVAKGCQDFELVGRRRRQHGMQRHDEWLSQLAREREDVLPVLSAEDPVLVLQQHDIDVRAAERPCRAHVVAARALGDGLEDVVVLRARRLVDDNDGADVVHVVYVEQRPPDIEGEGADPARAGWKRRKDRGTHAGVRPFRQMSEARMPAAGSIGWPLP